MLLKEIKIKNFRQFKGEQSIVFSSDSIRNLTVLLGDNTAGKTTLIQAFRWVLYGKTDFKTKGQLLNNDVERSMRKGDTEEVQVELSLIHDNMDYNITRVLRFKSYESGSAKSDFPPILDIYSFEDNQYRRIKEGHGNIIDKIMPEDLSEYFFFDGEKIEKVSEKRNIREAVHTLMGLTPVRNMIEHLEPRKLDSVHGEFRKRLIDTRSGEVETLKAKERRLKDAVQTLEERLNRKIMEKSTYEHEYEQAIIDCERCKEAIKSSKKREEYIRLVKAYNVRLSDEIVSLRDGFNEGYFKIFTFALAKKTRDQLSEARVDDKGIPDMNARAIDFILKRGVCICGTKLADGSKALEMITNQKNFLPPESIGTSIRHYLKDLDSTMSNFKTSVELVKKGYSGILLTREQIDNKNNDIITMGEEIAKVPGLKDVEESYKKASGRIKELDEDIINIGSNKNVEKTKLDNIEAELNSIISNDGINDNTNRMLAYTTELYKRMSNIYESKSRRILEDIRREVKDSFKKMYHGIRDIEIGDDYSVWITVPTSGRLDASTGLDIVKSFAFVSGLLKIAKESLIDDDDIQPEPYPLVMDAPFSNVDATHIKNISKELPQVAEQVIMMLMNKDWKHVESEIEETIGKKYNFNKLTETHTIISEMI